MRLEFVGSFVACSGLFGTLRNGLERKQRKGNIHAGYSRFSRQARNGTPDTLDIPPFRGGVSERVCPAPIAQARAEAAEWVRQHLPICSAFAAAVRDKFSQARMTYASENGHIIGRVQTCAFSVRGDDLIPIRKARK